MPAVDRQFHRPVPEGGRRDRPRHDRFGVVENLQAAGKGKTRSCDVLPDDIRELREEEVGDDDLVRLRQDIRVDDCHMRPASIHAST